MPAVHEIVETETERVERWRAEELTRAGFDSSVAIELALNGEIDLREAVSLLERGCSAELAVRILI